MISLERKIKIKIFIGKIQLFTKMYFWTDKFASISSDSIFGSLLFQDVHFL